MRECLIEVWDPALRAFHWLLAPAFLATWWTEGRDIRLHVLAGFVMAGLLAFRLAWGYCGPRHARFSDFRPDPGAIARHIRDLLRLYGKRYIGHTPLGSLMIHALLSCLLVIAASGMATTGLELGIGPFARWHATFSTETVIRQIHLFAVAVTRPTEQPVE